MKKTLIAVAALAATGAFAQNVTVSGTLDATYRSSKTETTAGTTVNSTRITKDGLGTTGFTLSGSEDLGGGLKADFLVETNFSVADTGTSDTGGTYSTAQTFVGLSGSFGAVKLGAPNAPTLSVQGARGASFSTKDAGRAALTAGGYSTLMGLAVTRLDSSIGYTSPNFSGFSFGLLYSPKSDDKATPDAGALSDVGLFYNNGPISAGVSKFNREIGGGGGGTTAVANKDDLTSYFVSYDFKFAKFGLGGHTYKTTDATGATVVDQSGLNLLAEVPLSPALSLTANLQRVDDKGVNNIDATQNAVGVQYALSKRSVTYARYIKMSADNTTGTTVKDADRLLVGLRHNF
ncbi:MAG: porin [Burkholderiales bacterium]|nr:porin [Burkholderiales bacterium]